MYVTFQNHCFCYYYDYYFYYFYYYSHYHLLLLLLLLPLLLSLFTTFTATATFWNYYNYFLFAFGHYSYHDYCIVIIVVVARSSSSIAIIIMVIISLLEVRQTRVRFVSAFCVKCSLCVWLSVFKKYVLNILSYVFIATALIVHCSFWICNTTLNIFLCWQCIGGDTCVGLHFEGCRPERCISSMIYSRDTPFWSVTLDLLWHVRRCTFFSK